MLLLVQLVVLLWAVFVDVKSLIEEWILKRGEARREGRAGRREVLRQWWRHKRARNGSIAVQVERHIVAERGA